jgi:prolyl 4-hydroxylase
MKALAAAVLVVLALVALYLFWPRPWSPRGYCDATAQWDAPVSIDQILTPEECRYIIQKAQNTFEASVIAGNDKPTDHRRSETAWVSADDPVAQKVLLRACELTGKTLEYCEDLQVVRYRPGMYYREHHDACCDNDPGCRKFDTEGGQRVGTLIVYLNSEFKDGETHFPNLNLKFRPDPGCGLFWRPLSSCNRCHPKALHAGLPITDGTKYICNAWVRERSDVPRAGKFMGA